MPDGRAEIEQVLRNWIAESQSSEGQNPPGKDHAAWVAEQFIIWWRERIEDSLGFAEFSAQSLREALASLHGSERTSEAFHELAHLEEALALLRSELGLTDPSRNDE